MAIYPSGGPIYTIQFTNKAVHSKWWDWPGDWLLAAALAEIKLLRIKYVDHDWRIMADNGLEIREHN